MNAESKRWRCLVCREDQESIDRPKLEICEECLLPLATKLCVDALALPITTPGIDREFWMRKADACLGTMKMRWKHEAR